MQSIYVTNLVENWKEKDYPIYLVVSLSTKQIARVLVSTGLINFEQFILTMIVLELQSEDVNAQPLLKANALKFLTTFHSQIPKTSALSIMPHLTRFFYVSQMLFILMLLIVSRRCYLLKMGDKFSILL